MVQITEVRLSRRSSKDGKLKAFATITFDNEFVIRDLKIIDGKKGFFVAMPSKKIYDSCSKCGTKNPIRNNFCGKCGVRLNPRKMDRREEHRDIAHPINSKARDYIQEFIVGEYQRVMKEEGSIPIEPEDGDAHEDYESMSSYAEEAETESEAEAGNHSEEPELADRLDI